MKTFGVFALSLLFLPPALLAQSAGPVPVRTALVQEQEVANRLEALGTARAWEFVSIRASETEQVTRIAFESGQKVKAGDLLVELNHAEELAELAGARASLERYQRDAERLQRLERDKLATREQLDAASTLVAETRARIAALEARIADRVIRAPFDGQLGLRNISLGTLVSPTTEIATLQDLARLKLDFTLPERQLPLIDGGMAIQARSQAHPGRVFPGEVMLVEARVDPQTRAFTVRAQLDNRDGLLKPGMLLTVEIISEQRQALTIPEAALVPLADTQSVYVLERGEAGQVARLRQVTLGRRFPGRVEVLSGLSADEQVVTRGTLHIRDGQAVVAESASGVGAL
ncbi:membrane fusion protein, multidrug efflux system [Microbulbifer donghaiensis]|uniref:Membrane fusion protein, multidrug efflux system n=1 Tax=Microbulbifer donghaiensis TaxID=494016 RepID=A0A1M5E627_9GAMM|nr:efflux RND transporter periplasmic adaptor subunit [Microbulbifer donghaiensis]SHF74718.1 membrane fusion protein, multidrug efflux system [Microbulbifer donghaiensis]